MQATYHLPPLASDPLPALMDACGSIGDRWSLPVVAALLDGPLRYTELRERLGGIAPNILTARLRSLESAGLITAHRYSSRPQRFEYQLTADGAQLAESVRALAAWATMRGTGAPGGPVHGACGTELERRWWCPACDAAVGDDGEDEAIAV